MKRCAWRGYRHMLGCPGVTRSRALYSSQTPGSPWKPQLVVFDQHGTLVDIHSTWSPWLQRLTQRLESSTGLDLRQKVYRTLSVCHFTKQVRDGLLAEGSSEQIRHYLERLLHTQGLTWHQAQDIVGNTWEDCPSSGYVDKEARSIFEEIKSRGIKIALCSSDDKRSTLDTLERANLIGLVDHVMCGDDRKDSTSNVGEICSTLGVDPARTVMIGDSVNDMELGREAKVAVNIGVLCGSSTRLKLSGVADVVTDDIRGAITYLATLDHSKIAQISEDRVISRAGKSDASLVIFDKDGTLLCFQSLWTPWAEQLMHKIEATTGLPIGAKVLDELGFCSTKKKWRPAVFTIGTTAQCFDTVADLLEEEGKSRAEAMEIVKQCWSYGDHSRANKSIRPLDCPASIFKTLQNLGVKVAVCTSDDRHGTEQFLHDQAAAEYVDMIVCGNDPESVPKPAAHNALYICDKLGVDPARAVMVGDTQGDMEMGRNARLGATVAVLTGVGDVEHLTPNADHMVPSISHVIDLVTPQKYKQYAHDLYQKELVLGGM